MTVEQAAREQRPTPFGEHRLAVLVPTRGRPGNAKRLRDAILDTAAQPDRIDLHLRIDADDPSALDYVETLGVTRGVRYSVGPRLRLAGSWNEQAAYASKNGATHYALWGDDVIPVTQEWDRILLERLDRDGHGFVYGRDGIWDHTYGDPYRGQLVLPTACVMTRELWRTLGFVSPPGLTHLCIDVAWRDLGLAAGCLFYEPAVLIRHFHRIAGAPDDDTYREANDNREQVRADNLAVTRWKASPHFRDCVERLRVLRSAR